MVVNSSNYRHEIDMDVAPVSKCRLVHAQRSGPVLFTKFRVLNGYHVQYRTVIDHSVPLCVPHTRAQSSRQGSRLALPALTPVSSIMHESEEHTVNIVINC